MRKNDNIYALYKGDRWLWDGTIEEIAEHVGHEKNYIKWFSYPSVIKRQLDKIEKGRDVLYLEKIE